MHLLRGICTLLDGRDTMMILTFFNSTKDQLFILFLYQRISIDSSPCTCLILLLRIVMSLKLGTCSNN
ncbi:hypothetical protein MTR67_003499 [Solanum verrucosum]|uniref:Uncharacterized protein n=1 Tax=Solanum verrucosum TaxID=315347 RepID=A0AAF0PY62_SOLVR|nr:hypothetical protein MTR67_003499 [Solanum verrucosum]